MTHKRGDLDWRLYAILDLERIDRERVVELAVAAVEGGATMLQLRGKRVASGELYRLSVDLQTLPVPLVVNDRVDVAVLAGAVAVHLGDRDLPLADARRLAPDLTLGRTVRTPGEAQAAVAAGADYLGVGAVHASRTKTAAPVIGLAGLASVTAVTACPVVAIGGIDPGNAGACIAAGAAGVAVSAALFGGRPDAGEVTRRAVRLRRAIDTTRPPGRGER